MNARNPQTTMTPRGGCLTNGVGSKRNQHISSKRVDSSGCRVLNGYIKSSGPPPSRSISCTSRPLRNLPARPSRVNTAVISSPRKNSAPCKLISAIGGSLDSLPDTVTIRRKFSTPVVRFGNHITERNDHTQSNNPIQIAKNKKFSAPAKLITDSYNQRISKDHTGSGNQQGSNGNSGSGSKGATGGPDVKASKKSLTYTIPENQPLPTLKEEKKSKHKYKKMSATPDSSRPSSTGSNNDPATAQCEPRAIITNSSDNYSEISPVKKIFPLTYDNTLNEMMVDVATSSTEQYNKPDIDLAEKTKLERMVSDLIKNNECKKQEIAALKMEINRLKEAARDREFKSEALKQDQLKEAAAACEEKDFSQLESMVDTLSAENRLLRDHLKQLGVSLDSSPLSDQQKEMILSRVSAFSQSGMCGENLSCVGERDWDNKSSSSISEISVACLQGRIQQMEETHYSTNEELQATLQELDDLREQLSECHIEVQQLQEEKQVILESLTQQTEKLNEARNYNDTLKLMLIQQSENSQDVSQCEKTQRLMELLKSVQEDKELTQLKQEEFDQQMLAGKEVEEHFHREAQLIRDRMKLLESMVESATNDKKNIESQLFEAQEIIKATEKESSRLKASLATAKEKITELEAAVISGEKSELAGLLERVCSEKEISEKEVASLHKKVNSLVCENEKLKDQVAALQDNLRVTRNNAKTNLDDVEWRRTQLDERRRELELEIETLKSTVADVQLTCQHHLEDKRDLKANLSDSQKKLVEMLERQTEIEKGFAEERASFARQVEEWEQFQRDLLTSVRVANDFKTEAQHNLEKIQHENQMLKERLRQLEQDVERARATSKLLSPANSLSSLNSLSNSISLGGTASDRRLFRSVSHMTNGEAILNDRRNNPRPLARGDSRVKSLIESIECATKQTKAGSRSSSTSSLASTGSENNNNNSVKSQLKRADTDGVIRNLSPPLSSISPLKESINTSPIPLRAINCNSMTDTLPTSFSTRNSSNCTNLPDTVKMSQLTNEKNGSKYGSNFNASTVGTVDGINKPMSILSNKIEPIRKNSYNQMSLVDKKDPLASLSHTGGSKRNALLKWCQNKTVGYNNVDITNFSSSWNDGLAFCALLDSYLPDKINYASLNPCDKKSNFEIAFSAAESVGIQTMLDINDMITLERPSWQIVFNYVTSIFSHFET